jgi:hypothetical protein
MSRVDITLIFDLLHAVALCAPLHATDYDPACAYNKEQVFRAFDVLHRHELTDSETIADTTGYRSTDYRVSGLTDKGRRIYQVLLQTQLALKDVNNRPHLFLDFDGL